LERLYYFLNKTCNSTKKGLETTGIFFLFIMTIIIWIQVIMRYVFNVGLPWAEEIAKFLMVWSAMLGAAVVLIENGHISVNFLYERIPLNFRRWVKIGNMLLFIVFFLVLSYQGLIYAEFGLKFISPATGIARFWPYLSIFVGGLFMLIFSVYLLISHIYESYYKTKPTSHLTGRELQKDVGRRS